MHASSSLQMRAPGGRSAASRAARGRSRSGRNLQRHTPEAPPVPQLHRRLLRGAPLGGGSGVVPQLSL